MTKVFFYNDNKRYHAGVVESGRALSNSKCTFHIKFSVDHLFLEEVYRAKLAQKSALSALSLAS